MLVLPTAQSVLLAPSPHQLALRHARNALAATTAPQTPHHGLVSIVAEATTALTALVLLLLAPTKCLRLEDGVHCKSKALHLLRIQPAASINAFGT